jgi:hypothetical protein
MQAKRSSQHHYDISESRSSGRVLGNQRPDADYRV